MSGREDFSDLLDKKRFVELTDVYVSHHRVAADEYGGRQPGAGEPVMKGPSAVASRFTRGRLDPDRISHSDPLHECGYIGPALPDGDTDDGQTS